jgi:hypothetical protein
VEEGPSGAGEVRAEGSRAKVNFEKIARVCRMSVEILYAIYRSASRLPMNTDFTKTYLLERVSDESARSGQPRSAEALESRLLDRE